MSNPDWCRWYPNRWITGTIQLSLEQRGFYVQVISVILDRGWCDAHPAYLSRLCNCQIRKALRLRDELLDLGKLQKDGQKLLNERAIVERSLAEKLSTNGRNRARQRWNNKDLDDASLQCYKKEKEKEKEKDSPQPPSEVIPLRGGKNGNGASPDGSADKPKRVSSVVSRGTRLSDDWEPGEDGVNYARNLGLSNDAIDAAFHAFMRYWLAKAGQAGRKVRWDLTWQTWVRNEHDKLREKVAREAAYRDRFSVRR